MGKRGLFLAVFVGFLLFAFQAEGADWKPLFITENHSWVYDAESVIYPAKGIVRMWVKYFEIDREAFQEEVKKSGNKAYEKNWGKTWGIELIEINCQGRTYCIPAEKKYSSSGKVLEEYDHGEFAPKRHIPPGSLMELFFKQFCPKSEGK